MSKHILVRGAGVAGLTTALELLRQGFEVTLFDPAPAFAKSASWLAGGMLAPWCEREGAEEDVITLGQRAADWWEEALPEEVERRGTLVVAPQRDAGELKRFSARTREFEWLDGEQIAALEPDLEGRFAKGLFFASEAHLDPRKALPALMAKLEGLGAKIVHDKDPSADEAKPQFDLVLDCTGASSDLAGLRGVRGEMLILECKDVRLSRAVRMLHPRIPIYIVPRAGRRFMVGATMIESEDDGPISARSMMELLNAAYALHPAFAEAKIVETGVGVRPAFADNLPKVMNVDGTVHVNGFYRHGFLLSPATAIQAADLAATTLKGAH
ncbi:MAG: glycine oxidase ThiO [Rhodobacteraceae bacterium]|nr:glycine oxidase ThiO [Paracoccaceae bacterium]